MKAIDTISQIQELVKKALNSRDVQLNKDPRSIRFPEALDARIAQEAEDLSSNFSEIVVRCVSKAIDAVVAEIAAEQEERLKKRREAAATAAPRVEDGLSQKKATQRIQRREGSLKVGPKTKPPTG